MSNGQMLIIRSKIAVIRQFCHEQKIAYRLYPLLGVFRVKRSKRKKRSKKQQKYLFSPARLRTK